jgi:hypothetical protein
MRNGKAERWGGRETEIQTDAEMEKKENKESENHGNRYHGNRETKRWKDRQTEGNRETGS